MKKIWKKTKIYAVGFLSAVIALLSFYFLRKGGSQGEAKKSLERAKRDAQRVDEEFDELEKQKKEPVEVDEKESAEDYWEDK